MSWDMYACVDKRRKPVAKECRGWVVRRDDPEGKELWKSTFTDREKAWAYYCTMADKDVGKDVPDQAWSNTETGTFRFYYEDGE